MDTVRYSRSERNNRKKRQQLIYRLVFLILVFALGFFIGKSCGNGEQKKTEKDSVAVVSPVSDDAADAGENVPAEEQVIPSDNSAESNPEPDDESEHEPELQNKSETEELNELKDKFVSEFSKLYPGATISIAIKNLDTGAETIHNNVKMNSASVIKLFILETVFANVQKGTYSLDKDAMDDLTVMITESSNNAANRFIDDFGGVNEKRKAEETNGINVHIREAGYKHTVLERKMHDTTPPEGPSGFQNYTCAGDVLTFLEKLYNKTLFEEPYNTQTLEIMKKQKRTSKIPGKIKTRYPGVTVANKTGELSQVENDVAIIMGDDYNVAFVVLVGDIPFGNDGSTDYALKNKIQNTISDFGLQLVEYYENK